MAGDSANFNLLHQTCKLVVLLCLLHISVTVVFYVRSLDISTAFVQNQQSRYLVTPPNYVKQPKARKEEPATEQPEPETNDDLKPEPEAETSPEMEKCPEISPALGKRPRGAGTEFGLVCEPQWLHRGES